MRKFWAYFKLAVSDALVYRAEGIIWMLVEVSEPLVALIFWWAAFQTHNTIAGYTLASMVLYYFGVMFINNLVATHPQYDIAEEIRSGSFSNYLLRPINFVSFKIAIGTSWRVVRVLFFMPLLLLLVPIFKIDIGMLDFSPFRLLLILISLVMAFCLHFFFKLVLGLAAIWFTEAGWLFISFSIVNSFFSGDLIPLDLFPAQMLAVANWLPFKYLTYFPLSLSLNRLTQASDIFSGLAIQFGWCVFFYLLYRLIWRAGSKTYSAYGG